MKLTTYSVGALAFTALSGAMPTRPRLIANAPATVRKIQLPLSAEA